MSLRYTYNFKIYIILIYLKVLNNIFFICIFYLLNNYLVLITIVKSWKSNLSTFSSPIWSGGNIIILHLFFLKGKGKELKTINAAANVKSFQTIFCLAAQKSKRKAKSKRILHHQDSAAPFKISLLKVSFFQTLNSNISFFFFIISNHFVLNFLGNLELILCLACL